MGINNPLPSSMASECKKCGKILASFIDPRQAFGPEKVIPPSVLAGAKGLAIITVFKAGFLGSARFGSGLVISRLPDGSWSAPSAIATGGAGFGGQIGFELTDFVFILNDAKAVKTFSQAGSLTLGGNVSLAAGPVGRNAEAAGAASLKSVAAVFSYSKTKGLFAGVSLEGSAIIERKEANARLYGRPVSASELLSGSEPVPHQAAPLLNILNSRAFNNGGRSGDDIYNDIPVYDDQYDNGGGYGNNNRRGYGDGPVRDSGYGSPSWDRGGDRDRDRYDRDRDDGYGRNGGGGGGYGAPRRSATTNSWRDDVYDDPGSRGFNNNSRSNTYNDSKPDSRSGPGRPAAPKPNFASKQNLLKKNEAVALFTFEADQPGDLAFKKGDVITVLKKTESDNDWWTGMIGTRHGIFPSNYVKMKE
ncbi:SH3 domain-containing protein [Sporothrix brasiliensis 5110]|uniref:SH3 domain-containing protein n=1 Tax=Sporothrix brasiliensis 5110 TaxID=1398154 RepID=A0A0C2FAX6_9PEZI|nr:SH3 domain-containing protein [Sporothrix brasiliensis 5110]KIH88213.1 SH3 domain-containing protein [Sporothrix brasiliensis 5110]